MCNECNGHVSQSDCPICSEDESIDFKSLPIEELDSVNFDNGEFTYYNQVYDIDLLDEGVIEIIESENEEE
jgi:hypothetical protein